jgi:hypothetical protein
MRDTTADARLWFALTPFGLAYRMYIQLSFLNQILLPGQLIHLLAGMITHGPIKYPVAVFGTKYDVILAFIYRM